MTSLCSHYGWEKTRFVHFSVAQSTLTLHSYSRGHQKEFVHTTRVHERHPQRHATESQFWQASILCLHYFWNFDPKKKKKKPQVYRTQKMVFMPLRAQKNLAQFLHSETQSVSEGAKPAWKWVNIFISKVLQTITLLLQCKVQNAHHLSRDP